MSDDAIAVQLSDFMEAGHPRAGLRVRVRVPRALWTKLGQQVVGRFRRFSGTGRHVAVVVQVGRKLWEFRPQDVEGPVS